MTDKVLYTAKTHTTGGRENGHAKSSDGQLEVRLSAPGSGRPGTNPEQLFASGWSACFEGAMQFVARQKKVTLPPETAIDAEVDLNTGDGGFFPEGAPQHHHHLPGVDRATAQEIVDAAHQVCPYSKATRGNIDVTITLV